MREGPSPAAPAVTILAATLGGSEMGAAVRRQQPSDAAISRHPAPLTCGNLSISSSETPSAELWSWMSWVQVPSSTPRTCAGSQGPAGFKRPGFLRGARVLTLILR
jgi:hypothetical protein